MHVRFVRVVLIVLVLGIGAALALGTLAPPDPARALAKLARRDGPGFAPRLSILPDPSARAGKVPAREVAALVRRLSVLAADGDARALHLRALADLMWAPRNEVRVVDRVIESLHTVERLQGRSAALYSDLAAAHLVRAERAKTPHNLVLAIEFAHMAVALEPRNAAAAYNQALALDRFHLRYQAAEAWRAVLALDGSGSTSDEARVRVRDLTDTLPARPEVDAPAALAAFARREPQWAREWAMDTLLPAWGTAVRRGEIGISAARLRAAAAIGNALESWGGDGTVIQAVRDIRRLERDEAATRRLAGAWTAYGSAVSALRQRKEQVPAMFGTVRSEAGESPVLRTWAEYYYGVAGFYAGEMSPAVFERLVSSVDSVRFPALAGRARWSLGTLASRGGHYATSRAQFAVAMRFFGRSREAENLGAVQEMDGEALFALGDEAEAYATMYRALGTLRPYGRSLRRHNLLFALVHYSRVDGFNEAALAIQGEDIAVTAKLDPGVRAEALLSRARAFAAAGRLAEAEADVQASVPLLDSIASTQQQAWVRVDQQTARAAIEVHTQPRVAAVAMDSVLAALGQAQSVERLLIALTQRAEARVALGDARGGAADLDSAAQVVGQLTSGIRDVALRASMLDARRRIFDGLALLYVRNSLPRQALLALERSRTPFGPTPNGWSASLEQLAAGRGEAAVEYALIADTLLTFVVTDTMVRLERRTVDGAGVQLAAEAARTRLELRLADDSTSALLVRLYDVLMRPVERHVARYERLALIVDGELGGVPFAALRDTLRKQYLFERHVLRLAPSVAGGTPLPRTREAAARAVFVADPAFRSAEFPALNRLPGAVAESRELATTYRGSVLLSEDSADVRRVRGVLSSASLFHFAGHAVFDDTRPARSYLVLAPHGSDAGRLSAEQIEMMDLRGLNLVVLAACQTQRSGPGRSGGFAGLSGAMLRAGAAGVVGSLWRVDDRLTRELMIEFHRAYRASGDAAAALRQAQVRLLRSPDPALRSPAAWSGFRYAGEPSLPPG